MPSICNQNPTRDQTVVDEDLLMHAFDDVSPTNILIVRACRTKKRSYIITMEISLLMFDIRNIYNL